MTGRRSVRRLLTAGAGTLVLAGCGAARGVGAPAGPGGPSAAAGGVRAGRCARDSVVVGYGAQSGCELTASVGAVAVDDRVARGWSNLAEILRGRVPGLAVYAGPDGLTLRVRGSSSFQGTGEPLLVLDGVPVSGSTAVVLASIEPRDVARVDVLKDAGSAAVYGARGANGVVLITTRRR